MKNLEKINLRKNEIMLSLTKEENMKTLNADPLTVKTIYDVEHTLFDNAYLHLEQSKIYYPDFKNWFYSKVVPGVISGKRKIIIETRNDNVAGIAIIKKHNEIKLSTLKVSDSFKNSGLGLKLFEKCFTALNTEKPFLTVSEEKLPEFKRIFDYYGFKLTNIENNVYRHGKKEYYYNE